MLFAGLQDVGHEDVATRCGVLSLRSLIEALQHYGNPASAPSPSSHKDRHYGRSTLPACLSLMLVEANRMLVTKTLPHDVATLAFAH